MRFFENLFARCLSVVRRFTGGSRAAKHEHVAKQGSGRTRLSVVCHQADLQTVRRRMHGVLVAVGAEIARVEVTPMESHAGLFSVCFTVTYPPQQRKALMDQVGVFADDASVRRIRFGSISAAEPRLAG